MSFKVSKTLPQLRNRTIEAWRRWFVAASGALTVVALVFLSACAGGVNTSPSVSLVTLSPDNVDFGAWRTGATSTPQNVTVTNSSEATLTLQGIKVGGNNAGGYTVISDNCGSTLPAGSSCVVTVTFSPSAANSFSASLTIAANASNSPQSVGLSGSGFSTNGPSHGMFILDPPTNDGNCAGMPSACYSRHLVPTLICTGNNTPVGYNCTRAGAGEPYVKGATFYVPWDLVSSSDGSYDFTIPDNRAKPWIDSGKLVAYDFVPTSQGSSNNVTPSWYLTPVNISTVSQTGGIIQLQTSADMVFFPGGVSAAAGLEIQVKSTATALDGNGTSANPGIWVVCDHHTPGCQDPTARKIFATGPGGNTVPVNRGKVGNPVYGTANCGSGTLPVEWRPNFIRAWQTFMRKAVAHYASNNSVAYLRFGLGIGGENIPNHGTSVAACQNEMAIYGFGTAAAPWPDPSTTQWPQVASTWIAYLNTMFRYQQSLNSPKMIATTLSPIETSGGDTTTPDATAANAVAGGMGIGNQGLQKNDPTNFAAGQSCFGGNWCANFVKYQGQVPLELQTLNYSDPTDASIVGSLTNTLPFATSLGAQILELYVEDWLCTYDSSWSGNNTYSACSATGYPVVFSAAAAQIN